jgi:hypothetical protein
MKKEITTPKEYDPKEFILEFFKDSKILDKHGALTISEVPKSFEEFIGKKAPYRLVFDIKLHNRIKNSELIMQGSYFLLGIRDYLLDKGQTSLLKLNVQPNLASLNKHLPKGSKILEIKPDKFQFISEFYFSTVYQYLNEQKQSIGRILVKDNKILDLDLSEFKSRAGIKEEIPAPAIGLEEDYASAKRHLDEKIKKEIKTIKPALKEKLEKELRRIKEHYLKQIKEKDEEVEACERKISMLQSKLRHTYYDRDMAILERQIRESKERLEGLKKKGYKERLKKEELFHINDEVEKHALSIKANLINATLIYYPGCLISMSSKGKARTMSYDPVFDKLAV